jgi:hypothetical protein
MPTFTIDSTPNSQICSFCRGLRHVVGNCLYKPPRGRSGPLGRGGGPLSWSEPIGRGGGRFSTGGTNVHLNVP